MNNTSRSFSDKWHKNEGLAFNQTLDSNSEVNKWILTRNGFGGMNDFQKFLEGKRRILDAGCGNGRVTALLRENSNSETTEVVGIDLTAADVAQANLSHYKNVKFYDKNLLDELYELGRFDYIYCQEVLHHTGNAELGFKNLVEILDEHGEIAIYVYKQKAPIREFTDDFIREKIKDMDYVEAIKVCDQITELGRTLSEYRINIKVPNVDILEIKEGEYDLQRFIYHFFAKMFWNNEFNFHDNSVINYDWYHPQDCTRHNLQEVRGWYEKCNIKVTYEFEDFYGITMKGIKM